MLLLRCGNVSAVVAPPGCGLQGSGLYVMRELWPLLSVPILIVARGPRLSVLRSPFPACLCCLRVGPSHLPYQASVGYVSGRGCFPPPVVGLRNLFFCGSCVCTRSCVFFFFCFFCFQIQSWDEAALIPHMLPADSVGEEPRAYIACSSEVSTRRVARGQEGGCNARCVSLRLKGVVLCLVRASP